MANFNNFGSSFRVIHSVSLTKPLNFALLAAVRNLLLLKIVAKNIIVVRNSGAFMS
jgi:hypothetical protein